MKHFKFYLVIALLGLFSCQKDHQEPFTKKENFVNAISLQQT